MRLTFKNLFIISLLSLAIGATPAVFADEPAIVLPPASPITSSTGMIKYTDMNCVFRLNSFRLRSQPDAAEVQVARITADSKQHTWDVKKLTQETLVAAQEYPNTASTLNVIGVQSFTGKPVDLILIADRPVSWVIFKGENTVIDKIVVTGVAVSTVTGAYGIDPALNVISSTATPSMDDYCGYLSSYSQPEELTGLASAAFNSKIVYEFPYEQLNRSGYEDVINWAFKPENIALMKSSEPAFKLTNLDKNYPWKWRGPIANKIPEIVVEPLKQAESWDSVNYDAPSAGNQRPETPVKKPSAPEKSSDQIAKEMNANILLGYKLLLGFALFVLAVVTVWSRVHPRKKNSYNPHIESKNPPPLSSRPAYVVFIAEDTP